MGENAILSWFMAIQEKNNEQNSTAFAQSNVNQIYSLKNSRFNFVFIDSSNRIQYSSILVF